MKRWHNYTDSLPVKSSAQASDRSGSISRGGRVVVAVHRFKSKLRSIFSVEKCLQFIDRREKEAKTSMTVLAEIIHPKTRCKVVYVCDVGSTDQPTRAAYFFRTFSFPASMLSESASADATAELPSSAASEEDGAVGADEGAAAAAAAAAEDEGSCLYAE